MLSVNCRVERKYDNNIYTISVCLRDFQRPFKVGRDNNGHIYLVGFIRIDWKFLRRQSSLLNINIIIFS